MVMPNKKTIYPDFSVLMSVYRKENPQFLDKALTSVEKQTVVPTEIILVEDGPLSTGLKKVIDRHRKSFSNCFKVIKSPTNKGLGYSLRIGTSYVTTQWIARMDTDDISVPDRFELQLKMIKAHPDLMLVGGQVQEFAGNSNNIVGYRKVPKSGELIRDFVKWRNPFNHPSVMINKVALEQVGGYIPFGNLEDYYLWIRMISHNYSVSNIDNILVKMRVDDGMYNRRGKITNIKYFFRLRKFMYSKGLINRYEQLMGNIVIVLNIIAPSGIRKLIYQKALHK